jgi:hypothetical protein
MAQKNPSFFIHVASIINDTKEKRYLLRILKTMHKIKRIFVVDDESDTCLTLTTVLEDNGFVVHTFNDSFWHWKSLERICTMF